MPPIKEYIFEDVNNDNIRMIIKAYSFEESFDILVSVTKHPSDFKCISV